MAPIYPPLPLSLILPVAWAGLTGRRRSFQGDARRGTRRLAVRLQGGENAPDCGPALLLINHYHRPGFGAWWFALALSAALPVEIHWSMTNAWTDDGSPGAKTRAWISARLLPRLANVYGFTSMPPMPPRAHEAAARAAALRRLLAAARLEPGRPAPLLALAPEGQDSLDGALMRPPAGVGRLLLLLAGMGYLCCPVGVYEEETTLVLNFGPAFSLAAPDGMERDRWAADNAMQHIAPLLPERLRGAYHALESPPVVT